MAKNLKQIGDYRKLWQRPANQHTFTQRRVLRLYDIQAGCCHICRKTIPHPLDFDAITRTNRPTIDHIIPLSRGGSNALTNIKLAHQFCNSYRGIEPMTKELRQKVLYTIKRRPFLLVYNPKEHREYMEWNDFRKQFKKLVQRIKERRLRKALISVGNLYKLVRYGTLRRPRNKDLVKI